MSYSRAVYRSVYGTQINLILSKLSQPQTHRGSKFLRWMDDKKKLGEPSYVIVPSKWQISSCLCILPSNNYTTSTTSIQLQGDLPTLVKEICKFIITVDLHIL
jgi:hypothetical protein